MFEYYMTAGDLKNKLKSIPDDVIVVYERIEDFYFNENHWKTIPIIDFEYSDREDYAASDDSQSIPAFEAWLTEGRDGKKYFFITAHY